MTLGGKTWTSVLMIVVCYAVLIPSTIALVFVSHGPVMIAVTSAFAIIAASLLLAWATESAQFMVSQSLALAILALLQVFPEYMFEATLAWNRMIEYASATMTGSNRLLMGAGWPLIFLIAYASSRRNGNPMKEIRLDARQAVEAFFLVLATVYSFVIVLKRMLDIIDGIVLLVMYLTYLWICMRIPEESEGEVEQIHGPAKTIISMKSHALRMVVVILLVLTGGVVIFSSAGPFVLSIMEVALILGFSQFLFAQWVAPFLSEFPESASAFYWAGTVRLSSMAIGNMVSSKVNQWTLLIGTIPLIYSLSVGHLAFIPLTPLQVEEILVTAAQSAFGCVSLLKLRFTSKEATILFSFWLAQFLLPQIRIEVTVAYLVLTAIWLAYYRNKITIFGEFKKNMIEHVLPTRTR
jgi:cation:H+ antiporter